MKNHPLVRTGRIGIIWALLSLFSVQVAFPSSFSNEGNTVPATPFDRKISGSHVFESNIPDSIHSSGESVWSLFMQARSFRYASNNGHWQTPEETEERHAGVCHDKAVWLYAKLKENGYTNARLVIGKYRQIDRIYHVWLTYTDENSDTFVLDPTIQKRFWKQGDFSEGFYIPYYSYDGQKRYCHKALGR